MRSSAEIKLEAKSIISANRSRVLLHALGFLAIVMLISYLYSYIYGLSDYIMQYYDAVLKGGELPRVPQPSGAGSVIGSLLMLASTCLQAGYQGYCLMRARGADPSFGEIFPRSRFLIRIIAIDLFTGLLVGLGSILFIIPGIILAYRYRLAIYVMYDNPELGAIACMRESGALMRGNKLRLFLFDLSFIGWILLSAFLRPADIWVQPYRGISEAIFYRDLVPAPFYGDSEGEYRE